MSAALWWSVLTGLVFLHIAIEAPKWVTWQSILAVGIFYIYFWYHALIEIELWRNEIYVVGFDPETGKGRVYKFFVPIGKSHNRFWQVWSRSSVDEEITGNSPTPLPEEWWWYRFWGWLTGERMSRIQLKGITGVWLEGKRISPDFEKAIKNVRATQPQKSSQPENGSMTYLLHEIRLLRQSGDLTAEKAQLYTLEILERLIYSG